MEKKGNGLGIAGFVIGILAAVLCWVPVLNYILAILAIVFGLIGCFGNKKLKGLAIVGVLLGVFTICIWKFYFVPKAEQAIGNFAKELLKDSDVQETLEDLKEALPAEN